MGLKGNVVEYLENGRFICAFVTEESGGRLRLLNMHGREVKMTPARIVHAVPVDTSGPLSREATLALLKDREAKREKLMTGMNLAELWELTAEEENKRFEPEFLAGLFFGEESEGDRVAALLRCVILDRLYFKYKDGLIMAHSPETVENLRHRLEQERLQQAFLDESADGINRLLHHEPEAEWPARKRCLQLLEEYYLFGKEASDANLARELIKKAGLTAPHAIYHLLVRAGLWSPHENIPRLRLQLPETFSEAALTEADRLSPLPPEELLAAGLRDFRHLPVLTIDGAGTQDFDDAIHLERRGENHLVGIHISDVARYVKPGSALYDQAMQRATSIYFPEGPLPMLPASLSENVFSLLAGEPRPVLSFLVLLSPTAEVLQFQVVPSMVTVHRQLRYPEVDRLLAVDDELAVLASLSQQLRHRRLAAGALLLPFPEINISLGEGNEVKVSRSNPDTPSRVLISELMVLANTLAAGFVADREAPGLFRSQPPPRQRLVHGLESDLLTLIRQRKKLSPMALSLTPRPHSSVGATQYTTVTSPIRRFLDLVMQHQILHLLGHEGPCFPRRELKDICAALIRNLARANQVRQQRHRYWLLRHLEQRVGERLPALLVEQKSRRLHLVLIDYMLDVDLPASRGSHAVPGDIIDVRLARVDALDNILRVEW